MAGLCWAAGVIKRVLKRRDAKSCTFVRTAKFIYIDRDTPMIFPPHLRDWLSENNMVYFVVDAEEISTRIMTQDGHFV
ncbi:MAG: hypothetical protein JXJ04_22570 [Spirochaetales bacterium]|nr:hypothetical protein [Spirochaetales bacterium]